MQKVFADHWPRTGQAVMRCWTLETTGHLTRRLKKRDMGVSSAWAGCFRQWDKMSIACQNGARLACPHQRGMMPDMCHEGPWPERPRFGAKMAGGWVSPAEG